MTNKLTLEEFIAECKNSPILKFSGAEITKDIIVKSGLKPKSDGLYYRSQMIDLSRLLAQNKYEIKNIFEEQNDNVFTVNPLSINGASKNLQLQHILYLFLTKNFQQFIKEKRDLFLIPKNGFKSYGERASWLNKFAKEIRKSSKNKLSFDKSKSFIWSAVYRLVNKECGKHSLSSRSSVFPYEYFVLDYFYFNDPFFNKKTAAWLTEDKKLQTQYKIPLPQKNPQTGTLELNILVFRETTKDDVIRTLNKEWKTINEWQKRLPPIPKYRKKPLDNIRRDFIIYQLSKNGLNDIEIRNQIRKEKYNLELNYIRKIISDTKKRIEETWGD